MVAVKTYRLALVMTPVVVMVVVMVVFLAACPDGQIDVTDAKELAPLVGLCLEYQRETSAVRVYPERGRHELWTAPEVSTVVIDEIWYYEIAENPHFAIFGDLATPDGRQGRAEVTRLFDHRWLWRLACAVQEGRLVQVEPDNMPIDSDMVARCSGEGNLGGRLSEPMHQ